jgi:diacylglycerol kinase (ATP)
MRTIMVFNPIAGIGAAGRAAKRLEAALGEDGHDVVPLDVGPTGERDRLPVLLEDADLLICIGGDGTVQANAPLAARTNTPVYQWPVGTENLFAREFGMDRRIETLRRATEGNNVRRIDLARCNGVPFLLMCSVGPDANIVHRLAAVRSGAITHRDYARHVLLELFKPRFVPLTVTVDGEKLIEDRTGLVVVANSRQYALRIDPAKHAAMDDGELDIVYFPISTRAGLIKWMLLSRLRRQDRWDGGRSVRGRNVEILNHGSPVPYQLDGEAANLDRGNAPASAVIKLDVERGALGVLVPD